MIVPRSYRTNAKMRCQSFFMPMIARFWCVERRL